MRLEFNDRATHDDIEIVELERRWLSARRHFARSVAIDEVHAHVGRFDTLNDTAAERFKFGLDNIALAYATRAIDVACTGAERTVLRATVVEVVLPEDRGLAEIVPLLLDADLSGVERTTVFETFTLESGVGREGVILQVTRSEVCIDT